MTIGSIITKKRKWRNSILRSRNMKRIHLRSKKMRSIYLKKIMKGGRKMKSRNVKSKTNKTRKRYVGKTRRIKKGLSIGGAGDETISLLPEPYKVTGLVDGSATPRQSALLAQTNADVEQNNMNNFIGGDPTEEDKLPVVQDKLPVVQFSGPTSGTTNKQSVELTNIFAESKAAGVGDKDVSVKE